MASSSSSLESFPGRTGLARKELSRHESALRHKLVLGETITEFSTPMATSRRRRPVFWVWDHENINPPTNLDGKNLICNIEKGLQRAGKEYYLWGGACYGNLNLFSPRQYCQIYDHFKHNMQMFNIARPDVRCMTDPCFTQYPNQPTNKNGPLYGRETDQADDCLLQHLLFYVNDVITEEIKPTILVVSSDADFVTSRLSLVERKCTLFVCVPKPSKDHGFNPAVVDGTTHAWYWEELSEGNGPTAAKLMLDELKKFERPRN